MKVVGLTGGIATGKSTVSNMISDKVKVIDADLIARLVVSDPSKPAFVKIKKEFGDQVIINGKEINREALGALVFSDESKRKLLNSIIHPYIRREMLSQVFLSNLGFRCFH